MHVLSFMVWSMGAMRDTIQLSTHKEQEPIDITAEVRALVARGGIRDGLIQVYAQGATAAIMTECAIIRPCGNDRK